MTIMIAYLYTYQFDMVKLICFSAVTVFSFSNECDTNIYDARRGFVLSMIYWSSRRIQKDKITIMIMIIIRCIL